MPGALPIVGNHGGAVENLTNLYLKYNESKDDQITVYNVNHRTYGEDKKKYKNTDFRIIDTTRKSARIKIFITKCINKIQFLFTHRRIKYFYYKVIKDLKKRHEENFYDVIIFENGSDDILYFRKKIKTKSKIILHLHNDYLYDGSKNCKKIYNSFDEIWAVSDFMSKRINSVPHDGCDKARTIYNAVDFSLFKKTIEQREKNELKNKYNIKENDVVFIYVGRILPKKGVAELTAAFNMTHEKNANTKLIICGKNNYKNSNKKFIQRLKRESGDGIIFVGQISNDKLYKYYQISDYQIIPTKQNESFGLIALEGVASGVKIIATKQGALPEILGKYAVWVDTNNMVQNLEAAMRDAIDNRKEAHDASIAKSILEKFSLEKYQNNIFDALCSVKKRKSEIALNTRIDVIMRNDDKKINAGFKANSDIADILKCNYQNIHYHIINEEKSGIIELFKKIILIRKKRSIVIMQLPLHNKLLSIIPFRLHNTILIIHDINGLRKNNKKMTKREMRVYKKCDAVISHNETMTDYLVANGINGRRITNLEFFDYICKTKDNIKVKNSHDSKNVAVVYMGNLVIKKAPFLRELQESRMSFRIKAYGDGGDDIKNLKIKLCGSIKPDEAPNKIDGDLGLIWDGNYDERDQNVGMKNYTKYNNPHKLSCYLAAGLPVVAWEKSAIAKTIKKYNIGYTIRNIYDINNLDFSDYEVKRQNAIKIGNKIRSGYYTKKAISDALNNMEHR